MDASEEDVLAKVLCLLIGGLFVFNGMGAALMPRRWVDSVWVPKGPLTREDLEKRSMNIQVRIVGGFLACFGFAAMVAAIRALARGV